MKLTVYTSASQPRNRRGVIGFSRNNIPAHVDETRLADDEAAAGVAERGLHDHDFILATKVMHFLQWFTCR